MAWVDLERNILAQQIRELERVKPKLARKLMFDNPKLLEVRKQAALDALRRRA